MKNARFAPTFLKAFCFNLAHCLVVCACFIGASHAGAQGEDSPTGLAGGFGGSITTGGGSFDPYERNASRSVTDIVVPGAVIPFTFTRIWNSRGGPPQMNIAWRYNWEWDLQDIIASDGSGTGNDLFKGYNVHYPDGRVVKFDKPASGDPVGAAGTYRTGVGIRDRFVIQPDRAQAHLFLTDGTVVNFDMHNIEWGATSIVDPHQLTVTITNDGQGKLITEPGGRWIHISWPTTSGDPITCEVTTSLGQHVTYAMSYGTTGYLYDGNGDQSSDSIKTNRATVTYHDVLDPATGLPLEAHYIYKCVKYPSLTPHVDPTDGYRLIWASDPMFDGPLQQVKFVYVDHGLDSNGDYYRSAVLEERWATNYWNPGLPDYHQPGVLISGVQMPPADWLSPEYWTRLESTGYGATRTISYFNRDRNYGQTLVDHFTDFKNDLNKVERHEYDWGNYFQTPIRITDPLGVVTEHTLEPVLGQVTQETHPQDDYSYRSWTYTDQAYPYYVESKTDELRYPTVYTRDPYTHLATHIDHPGAGEDFTYNQFNQVLTHQLPSGTPNTSTMTFAAFLIGNGTTSMGRTTPPFIRTMHSIVSKPFPMRGRARRAPPTV